MKADRRKFLNPESFFVLKSFEYSHFRIISRFGRKRILVINGIKPERGYNQNQNASTLLCQVGNWYANKVGYNPKVTVVPQQYYTYDYSIKDL